MAETNINFTPAQDVEKIYDDSLITELNYDKVKNIIDNDIKTAAKGGNKTATIMFRSFASNYQKIVWPTLLSKVEYEFNPYTHSSVNSAYTYPNRHYNEVGHSSTLGACDAESPFAVNVLKLLAEAGYSWLFIFAQNEEYPNGMIVSCDGNYAFENELLDPSLAYNEIIKENQVILNKFTITMPDGQPSPAKSYFYKNIQELFTVFNSLASGLSSKGEPITMIPWQSFSTDMRNFLYKEAIDIKNNTEPLTTLEWEKDPAQSSATYTQNSCVDFAVYRDDKREILATDSWQTTLKEKMAADDNGCYTILQLVRAISDYYFKPVWTSKTEIGGIYFCWTPEYQSDVNRNFQDTVFNVSTTNNLDYDTAYVVDAPDITDYETTKAEVNGQYLVNLLTQISAGLTTAMKNSEQTVTILWSSIDSLNSGVVRDFWNNTQKWTADIYKKDTNKYPSGSQSMSDAVVHILDARILSRIVDTGYNSSWTEKYLITPIYYKEQKGSGSSNGFTNPKDELLSCGITIGYNSSNAYNRMKTIYEDYINNKTSSKA